jgi:tRNA (cytidine/uridine-2'-O-)-methyltransferase
MSTKGSKIYAEASFKDGDFLVFGRETRGLPEPLLEKHYDSTLRIPMIGESRSLNLANSVALTLYEAIRQNGFENLKTDGELTGRGY